MSNAKPPKDPTGFYEFPAAPVDEQPTSAPQEASLGIAQLAEEAPTAQELQAVAAEPEPIKDQAAERKERNLRTLRQKAEEADQWKKRAEEAEERAWRMASQQNTQQPATKLNHNPEDLVEYGTMQREVSELKQQLAQVNQNAFAARAEAVLRAQYADFDQVVSRENVEILKADYPELAATLMSSQDIHAKAVSAYTMIKRLGIAEETIKQTAKENQGVSNAKRITENRAKPRDVASVGVRASDSPLTQVNSFQGPMTETQKAALRAEMKKAIHGPRN